jgi:hypothetical protein
MNFWISFSPIGQAPSTSTPTPKTDKDFSDDNKKLRENVTVLQPVSLD